MPVGVAVAGTVSHTQARGSGSSPRRRPERDPREKIHPRRDGLTVDSCVRQHGEAAVWPVWKLARRAKAPRRSSTLPWDVSGCPQSSGSKQSAWPAFRGPERREQQAPLQRAKQRGIQNHASVVLSVAPPWSALSAWRSVAGLSLGMCGLCTRRLKTRRQPESRSFVSEETAHSLGHRIGANECPAGRRGGGGCGPSPQPAPGAYRFPGARGSRRSRRPKAAFPLCLPPSVPGSLPPAPCPCVALSFPPFLTASLSPTLPPS